MQRAKSGGELVSAFADEKELKDEVNRRTYKAGYTTQNGEPPYRTKIMSLPPNERYRKSYDRIFGERKLNLWPRDKDGNLIEYEYMTMAVKKYEINKDLPVNSTTGGVVIVTITGSPVDISPSVQPCQSCLVQVKTGTVVYMEINAVATNAKWLLSTTVPIPVPVTDLSMLHFIGASGNETVQILWRDY